MPFQTARSILLQQCKALQALHDQDIIHRDVKPSNIILSPNGVAILIDLGVARCGADHTAETATGSAPGTWQYQAPEQWRDPLRVDQRADIYSLGMVIYELLAGDIPGVNAKKASTCNPSVPPAFDDVLFQMLERNPDSRPSIRSLIEGLERDAPPSPSACPQCQFQYGWDGKTCFHCGFPTPRPGKPHILGGTILFGFLGWSVGMWFLPGTGWEYLLAAVTAILRKYTGIAIGGMVLGAALGACIGIVLTHVLGWEANAALWWPIYLGTGIGGIAGVIEAAQESLAEIGRWWRGGRKPS